MSFENKYADKLAEASKKAAIINKWPRKLKRLKKDFGIDQKKFCESLEPALDPAVMSRLKKGGIEAEWETIERIEAGFKKHLETPVNKKRKTTKKRNMKK